jgi:putative membrane protein
MQTSNLPFINALLNLCSTLCLMSGYYFIRFKKDEFIHKCFMLLALAFSTVFLSCYLYYHYHHGSTKFPDLGWIKTLYLIILIPHIILAVVMVPMIILTFKHAFTQNFILHKKWAKITFPIWMYVSITGVIIYLFVYQWFKN